MIIDGKKIAEDILRTVRGAHTLGVVMNVDNPVSESFVKMKERAATRAGVTLQRFAPEDMAKALLCDGVLVQLPIADAERLVAMVPPEKDVDALSQNPLVLSPVAEAIQEIFVRAQVVVPGKRAVVVGAGRLVGKPAADLLRRLGAEVSVVTMEEGSLEQLQTADIVVLGAGNPGMVKPKMLKPGVVLIDAGTSDAGGLVGRRIAGDADPACAQVASVFTPVPGGVGPVAVAMIFKNLQTLVSRT